jgi:hypothetical protein
LGDRTIEGLAGHIAVEDRTIKMQRAVYVLSVVLFAMAGTEPGRGATCESISTIALKDTNITLATTVAAGVFTLPGAGPAANPSQNFKMLPEFCRVAGVIKPSSDSHIEFEVWMPTSGWNGKFEGIDNGGFAGNIHYGLDGGLAGALLRGYATASTDTGHKSGPGVDGSWALGHPEKIVDFGYRAIHLTAGNAKAIIRAFYGESPRRSYFAGCSNGGRQALMEAQRFPNDYDGIIAGAPANFWTHLLMQAIWSSQALLQNPASYIPAAKLPAIESAALRACDATDGVKDGVIDDPPKCHFDPAKLLCHGAESDSCLTRPQVEALKKLYDGPRNAKSEQIFPGYVPGAETGRGGWGPWITGSAPKKSLMFAFGSQFFADFVFSDANWDYRTFNFDRDVKPTDDKMASILNATDPNLKAFKNRGGKLILYHGWSDAAISALNSVNYYKSVAANMGQRETDSFVKLFMAPGMQHCAGGPGPDLLARPGAEQDPERDLDLALVRWVEKGIAPAKLIAAKRQEDANLASAVLRTRPLCPYPQVVKYKGTGSIDDASNFTCLAAK